MAVILDEAYVEFSTLQDPDESLPLLDEAPEPRAAAHLLEGLRAVRAAGRLLARRLGRLPLGGRPRAPAVLASTPLAQAAAAEALEHQDEVANRVERTAIERLHIEEELGERGLETTDSEANFSWVSLGDRDEAAVLKGLAERGVIVRGGGGARRRRATSA